jgi:hypothetical protein
MLEYHAAYYAIEDGPASSTFLEQSAKGKR